MVAAALMLGWPLIERLLQLAPADGSNGLIVKIAAVLILTFGYAYFMVGLDPVRYRPYVSLGMIGKLLVVIVALPMIIAGSQGYLLAWVAIVWKSVGEGKSGAVRRGLGGRGLINKKNNRMQARE